jgi:hypothetical protein
LPNLGQELEQVLAHEVPEEVRQPELHYATAVRWLEPARGGRQVALDEHNLVASSGEDHSAEEPDWPSSDYSCAHQRPLFDTLIVC